MIIDTFKYKQWADQMALQSIEKVDLAKFPDRYSFMLQQINHMIIVEDLFKSRLLNAAPPHTSTNTKIVPDFKELKERLLASGKWYLNYVTELAKEKFNTTIAFTFSDGKNGSMSIEEILFHIINHGSYHRGSIAHSLDQAGVPHPPDGYGIYIHESDPDRRINNSQN